jgi:hypothetical protein
LEIFRLPSGRLLGKPSLEDNLGSQTIDCLPPGPAHTGGGQAGLCLSGGEMLVYGIHRQSVTPFEAMSETAYRGEEGRLGTISGDG